MLGDVVEASRRDVFDIHGGGIDLIFPHHENEIAQSRCAFHTPVMANYWMHNGFLQVEGEKMSKSLGNFVTIHELLNEWHGCGQVHSNIAMLQTHYRQPINWTLQRLEQARQEIGHGRVLYYGTPAYDDYRRRNMDNSRRSLRTNCLKPVSDDLNTPTPSDCCELHRLSESIAEMEAIGVFSEMCRLGVNADTIGH